MLMTEPTKYFSTAPAASSTPIRIKSRTVIPFFSVVFSSLFCIDCVVSIIISFPAVLPHKNYFGFIRLSFLFDKQESMISKMDYSANKNSLPC
jgi:hypothetical protein